MEEHTIHGIAIDPFHLPFGWTRLVVDNYFFFLGGGKENRAGDDEKGNKHRSDCNMMIVVFMSFDISNFDTIGNFGN